MFDSNVCKFKISLQEPNTNAINDTSFNNKQTNLDSINSKLVFRSSDFF